MWPAEWIGEEAQAQLKRLPGDKPIAFEAGPAQQGARDRRRAARDRAAPGSPREPADEVIAEMEAARAPVVAADIPSGVDATTGEVAGPAVHCVATATFHRPKVGLWVRPGKEYAGEVETIDIGIPRGGPARPEAGLIGAGVLRDMPRRTAASTKFSSGNVFIIGGSRGLTGAPSHGRAGRHARGRGLRDGRRARQSRAELHGETAGGDDGRTAGGRRRPPRRVRRGAGAQGGRARRRGRAGPRPLEGPGRAGARARGRAADRRPARDRRGRAQRARRAPRGRGRAAPLADGPHAAQRRARAAARARPRTRSSARASRARARRRRARRRSSCSRATTRS